MRPAYFLDSEDYKNIRCAKGGSEWNEFIHIITEAVKNRNSAKYPCMHLNKDSSISLILSNDETNHDGWLREHCKSFIGIENAGHEQHHIIEQLEYHAADRGFAPIGGGALLESIPHPDSETAEYKLILL